MKNKKQVLLEELAGSVEMLNALSELSDGVDICKHWEFSNEKKCEDFRAWISSVNGEVFNIPQGEFNCSGTPIETRAIIIRKNVL